VWLSSLDYWGAIRGKNLPKYAALCKHFWKNIMPENSPAKFLGPKSFRVFWETIYLWELIYGTSAVRLAILSTGLVWPHWQFCSRLLVLPSMYTTIKILGCTTFIEQWNRLTALRCSMFFDKAIIKSPYSWQR